MHEARREGHLRQHGSTRVQILNARGRGGGGLAAHRRFKFERGKRAKQIRRREKAGEQEKAAEKEAWAPG